MTPVQRSVYGFLRSLGPRELVERTVAASEARIVAWLRRPADEMEAEEVALISRDWGQRRYGRILGWWEAAKAIECGEHRQNQESAGQGD